MKRNDFNSFEEFENSNTAGEWETVTVIHENGWVKCDLLTECKSYKTAIRRFFKMLGNDGIFESWQEGMIESAENGYFKLNDFMMADGSKNPFPGYAYEIEATGENEWYIFLNLRESPYTETKIDNTDNKEEEKTMYQNIRKNITEEINGYREKALSAIQSDENGLERNSTVTRWNQYKAGKITREKAVEFAAARIRKEYARRLEKKLSRLDLIAAAPEVKNVSISVSWYHNRYWGWNPTATVEIETTDGIFQESGHASGCGYDKLTAAVGEALNKCNAVVRMLCDKKESALENVAAVEYSNRNYIAYGAGYGAIPYFEGGVGMSSFESVFNACGFKLTHFHETKTTNYYYFEKETEE